jgi:hypothetical protein
MRFFTVLMMGIVLSVFAYAKVSTDANANNPVDCDVCSKGKINRSENDTAYLKNEIKVESNCPITGCSTDARKGSDQ